MIKCRIDKSKKWDIEVKRTVAAVLSQDFSLVQSPYNEEDDWQWEEKDINQQIAEDVMTDNEVEHEEVEASEVNNESEAYEADDEGVVRELPEIPLATNVEYV